MRFLGMGLILASSCVLFHEGTGAQGGAGADGPSPGVTSSGGSGGSGGATPCTPSMTSTDPDNCGVCGHACGPGAECVDGECGSFGRDLTGVVVHDLAVFDETVVLAVGGQKAVDALWFFPVLFDEETAPVIAPLEDAGGGFIARVPPIDGKLLYAGGAPESPDLHLCDLSTHACVPRNLVGVSLAIEGLARRDSTLYVTIESEHRLMRMPAACVLGVMACDLEIESPLMKSVGGTDSTVPPTGLARVEGGAGVGEKFLWNTTVPPNEECLYVYDPEADEMPGLGCMGAPGADHMIARGRRAYLATRAADGSRHLSAITELATGAMLVPLVGPAWPADTDGELLYAHFPPENSTGSRLKVLEVMQSGDFAERGELSLSDPELIAIDASHPEFVVFVTNVPGGPRLQRWSKPVEDQK